MVSWLKKKRAEKNKGRKGGKKLVGKRKTNHAAFKENCGRESLKGQPPTPQTQTKEKEAGTPTGGETSLNSRRLREELILQGEGQGKPS